MKQQREWLKQIRTSKGMTQTEVAIKGGFARSYYTMVESGNRTPSVNMAKQIGKILDFDWYKFFE